MTVNKFFRYGTYDCLTRVEFTMEYDPMPQDHKLSKNMSSQPRPLKTIGSFELTRTLGQGSMGKVKLAVDSRTGEKRACKIMYAPRCLQTLNSEESYHVDLRTLESLPNLSQNEGIEKCSNNSDRKDYEKAVRLIREATIMLVLDHPNIVKLHELFYEMGYYYFIFELVSGGQMLDYIISHGKLKERNARKFFFQMMSAVDYCHRNNIAHRDLKIENILIDQRGNIKIIDFGLGNFYSTKSHLSTYCGSLYFAAPELLASKPYIGPEIDMWSLGIILYVLVTGKVPFDDTNIARLHQKIKDGNIDFPPHVSNECRNLLLKLICVSPLERGTMEQIKTHPWILASDKPSDHPIIQSSDQPSIQQSTHPSDFNQAILKKMAGFQFKDLNGIELLISSLPKTDSETFPEVSAYFLVYEKLKRMAKEELENTGKPQICLEDEPIHKTEDKQKKENQYYLRPLHSRSVTSLDMEIAFERKNTMHFSIAASEQKTKPILDSTQRPTKNRFLIPPKIIVPKEILPQSSPISKDSVNSSKSPTKTFQERSAAIKKRFDEDALNFLLNVVPFHRKKSAPEHISSAEEYTEKEKIDTGYDKLLNSQRRKSLGSEGELRRLRFPLFSPEPSTKGISFSKKTKNHRSESKYTDVGRADESVRTASLKGLFSVSNTSTKKPNAIRQVLMQAMESLCITFTEHKSGFECSFNSEMSTAFSESERRSGKRNEENDIASALNKLFKSKSGISGYNGSSLGSSGRRSSFGDPTASPSSLPSKIMNVLSLPVSSHYTEETRNSVLYDNDRVISDRTYFEVYIVKIPLLEIYGIQFRRIAGDPWQYKRICTKILEASML